MRKSIQIKIINKKTDKPIYIEDYEDAKDTFDKLMDLMDVGIVKLVEGTLITNDADDVIRYFKIKWKRRGRSYSEEELSTIEAKVEALKKAGLLAALDHLYGEE